MMLEGWQNLAVNQMVNAQFRGQQVLRLADRSRRCCAHGRGCSSARRTS